jgi:hypothetical protein
MKKMMFLMIFTVSLVLPIVSYAETAQEYASDCVNQCQSLGSGKEYAACVQNCLQECYDKPSDVSDVPPPQSAYPQQEKTENNTSIILAQNENYIACYKDVDMKPVLFRWCPTEFPWTATTENRTNCYVTAEACMEAEWPQGWCIKCGNKDGS